MQIGIPQAIVLIVMIAGSTHSCVEHGKSSGLHNGPLAVIACAAHGRHETIATARIWNPDFTWKFYDPELAAMAKLCRKGAEKPEPPPQVTREPDKSYQGELPF